MKEFLDLKFVEAYKLILRPKKQTFGLYMVLSGSVARLQESSRTQYFLKKLLVKKQTIEIQRVKKRKREMDPIEMQDCEEFQIEE